MLVDFHVHSRHSEDCHQTVATMCEAAARMGVEQLCFTDHIDIGVYPGGFTIREPEKLVEEVLEARAAFPQMEILLGAEVGAMPKTHGQEVALLNRLPLDFLLLSCHDAGGIDPYDLSCYEGRTREQAVEAYFRSILTAVTLYERFSSLAHIGYIYRYISKYGLYGEDARRYLKSDAPDILDAVLLRVIEAGASLEINMSEYERGVTMPHADILRRYAELGGRSATYGSDAHFPQHIARFFPQACELLKSVGISFLATYRQLSPTYHKL